MLQVRISAGATFTARSTQPSIPPGSANEYKLRLGSQSQAGARERKISWGQTNRCRDRDAEGVEAEAPNSPKSRRRKHSRGWVWGGSVPLPIGLRGLGSVVSSPAGSGAEPRRKTNSMHSGALRRPLAVKILIVL